MMKNPAPYRGRDFLNPTLLKRGVLFLSRAALQSCPTPGLRGRLIHGRLLHSASASTSPGLSGFGPSPAEWLARSFARLLERRRSNLCNATRDRTKGIQKRRGQSGMTSKAYFVNRAKRGFNWSNLLFQVMNDNIVRND